MKNYYFFLLFLLTTISNAQWVNLNTGINDNLTGAVFLDENGLIKDAAGYHRALSIAMNPDKFAKFFYEQGMSDATDTTMKQIKNIKNMKHQKRRG